MCVVALNVIKSQLPCSIVYARRGVFVPVCLRVRGVFSIAAGVHLATHSAFAWFCVFDVRVVSIFLSGCGSFVVFSSISAIVSLCVIWTYRAPASSICPGGVGVNWG